MRNELRLTMLVEYVHEDGSSAVVVREQADCRDVFALAHEFDHVTGPRFRTVINETFLAGTRDLDAQKLAG